MATKTLTDTTDFGAKAHCSIESGSVKIGKYNFSTDDTGTGLGDFSVINASAADAIDVTTNPGQLTIDCNATNSTVNGSTYSGPGARLVDAILGDFEVVFQIASNSASQNFSGSFGLVHATDTNFFRTGGIFANGLLVDYYSTTNGQVTVAEDPLPQWYRMVRSGSTGTFYYGGSSAGPWTQLQSEDISHIADVALQDFDLICGTWNTSNTLVATFDNLTFVSGSQLTAQAYVGDNGTGDARYLDAGLGNTFDYSSLSPTLTNATVTWDVKESDSSTFDGSTWDATGLTTAQLQARADSNKRYIQLRANLTATGTSPSLDAVSIDTITV